jgi:hypothetical protein
MPLPTSLLRRLGCDSYYWSFINPSPSLPWFIVIMSPWCICQLTQCSIDGRNISRTTFISSMTKFLWERCACCMFPLLHSMQISSRKGCLLLHSHSSGPVSMFGKPTMRLRGAVRLHELVFGATSLSWSSAPYPTDLAWHMQGNDRCLHPIDLGSFVVFS